MFLPVFEQIPGISRPGKENDKIPDCQGFPGRVGTLTQFTI